jgi:ADP-heptose:LPS heptosyltransferase
MYDAGPMGGDHATIFEGLPYFSEMIPFSRTDEQDGDKFVRWIYDRHIDICIQSYPSDSSYDWLWQYLDCEIRKAPRIDEPTQHETEYNLDLVKDLVGPNQSIQYKLPSIPLGEQSLERLHKLMPYSNYVVLCPSFKKEGAWQKKNWGVKNYAELARLIHESGRRVALVDGPDGVGVCNAIKFLFPHVTNLAGLTSLRESMYVLENADAVICNDCGPMHIAAAYGRPVMAFFGPTSVVKNQPLGERVFVMKTDKPHDDCRPGTGWDGCSCITLISPHLVFGAFEKYVVPILDTER